MCIYMFICFTYFSQLWPIDHILKYLIIFYLTTDTFIFYAVKYGQQCIYELCICVCMCVF